MMMNGSLVKEFLSMILQIFIPLSFLSVALKNENKQRKPRLNFAALENRMSRRSKPRTQQQDRSMGIHDQHITP